MTVGRPSGGGVRLRALTTTLRLLVRMPTGPPLPFRAQRAWSELIATTNRPGRRVPRFSADASGVPLELHDGSEGAEAPSILYLHGGGYTLHSPRVYRPLCSSLARAARAVVYAAHYRRAPEHPFPAALDDALACYRWLLAAGKLPDRIAIAGDSAGGGLALCAAIAIRDSALPQPAALALISPWADLTLSGPSLSEEARAEVILRRSWLAASARAYLGGLAPDDERCSPLFADLAGLPPMLIQGGAHDILRSDSERLAERAGDAGVSVELDLRPGLFHVFQEYPGVLPEAEAALGDVAAFLDRSWRV